MPMVGRGPSADSPDPTAAAALAEALRARLEVAELRSQVAVLAPPKPPIPPAARLHLFDIQALRDAAVIAGLFGILWLGYKISLVTVPILLAMLLAYLFEPLVRRMVRTRWFSRQGAAL